MGTNSSVSSADFRPKSPRFFLPGSRILPFSSGTTATESRKNFWNWFLPWFKASVSAPASGAIFSRNPLMMPVRVVSPIVPVSEPVCPSAAGAAGRRGSAGLTGCAAAGVGAAVCTGCTVVRGAAVRGEAGAAAVCRGDTGAGAAKSSKLSRSSRPANAILWSCSGVPCSGVVEMPTLRRISSTW